MSAMAGCPAELEWDDFGYRCERPRGHRGHHRDTRFGRFEWRDFGRNADTTVTDQYERDRIEAEVKGGALRCCATNYCEADEMCYCEPEEHAACLADTQPTGQQFPKRDVLKAEGGGAMSIPVVVSHDTSAMTRIMAPFLVEIAKKMEGRFEVGQTAWVGEWSYFSHVYLRRRRPWWKFWPTDNDYLLAVDTSLTWGRGTRLRALVWDERVDGGLVESTLEALAAKLGVDDISLEHR